MRAGTNWSSRARAASERSCSEKKTLWASSRPASLEALIVGFLEDGGYPLATAAAPPRQARPGAVGLQTRYSTRPSVRLEWGRPLGEGSGRSKGESHVLHESGVSAGWRPGLDGRLRASGMPGRPGRRGAESRVSGRRGRDAGGRSRRTGGRRATGTTPVSRPFRPPRWSCGRISPCSRWPRPWTTKRRAGRPRLGWIRRPE